MPGQRGSVWINRHEPISGDGVRAIGDLSSRLWVFERRRPAAQALAVDLTAVQVREAHSVRAIGIGVPGIVSPLHWLMTGSSN